MRIGLVGYFGWGNFGDELFVEVYKKIFADHELVYFHSAEPAGFLDNADAVIDSVDAIVIGGGDLLIPWNLSWLYWDERFLTKPVYVFGVGVPTWGAVNAEVMEHYRKFLNHPNVKMIGLRDEESMAWVRKNLVPEKELCFYPDMVLGLDFPKAEAGTDRVGLVLRRQDKYNMTQIYKVANMLSERGKDLALIMLATGRTLDDDRDVLNHFYFPNMDIVYRDTLEKQNREISKCSHLISMKFHGVVASYKCEVPFISLSGADKFQAFCRQTGNTDFSSNVLDPKLADKVALLLQKGTNFSGKRALISEAREGWEQLKSAVLTAI